MRILRKGIGEGSLKMRSLAYPELWFTYGPQTDDGDKLLKILEAGATGVRLTFSYGTPELQIDRARKLREISSEAGREFFIVADLQGGKSRFATIPGVEGFRINKGSPVLFTARDSDPHGNPVKIPLQDPSHLSFMDKGDILVEGDGSLILKVAKRTAEGVLCMANDNGLLRPGRGFVMQKPGYKPSSLTPKDAADLEAVVKSSLFDAIAISFVSKADDVIRAKRFCIKHGKKIPVIAKIETQLGIDNIGGIAREADMLMAARGDLALTAPWEELPSAVDKISAAAKKHGKPWILATQLAEGLERFSIPTRAEICDLAHWISEGAFGAMLSYETAFGPKPVESVAAVRKIIDRYKK